MRSSTVTIVALALVAAGTAGVAGGCRKGSPATLDPGEDAVVTFLDTDYLTEELETVGEIGLTEAELQAALAAERPGGCTDAGGAPVACYPFALREVRWIGARIHSAGVPPAEVRVRPDGPGARDFLMICRPPSGGALVGTDDVSFADCHDPDLCMANNDLCAPRTLMLEEQGNWLCLFTVSPCGDGLPSCSPCFDPNDPVDGSLRISVE